MSEKEFVNTVADIAKSIPAPRLQVVTADPSRTFTVKPPTIGRFEVVGKDIALDEEELREMEALKEGDDGKPSSTKPSRFDLDRTRQLPIPERDLKLRKELPNLRDIRPVQKDESSKKDDATKEGEE